MDSRLRSIGAIGVLLIASAVLLPWAKTGYDQLADPVSGFGRGLEVVLLLAGVGALALLFGNRLMTFSSGAVAAAWTAVASYTLPGSLLDNSAGSIGVAGMSWGAFLAFAGSIVLALAAVPPPRDLGIRSATSRG